MRRLPSTFACAAALVGCAVAALLLVLAVGVSPRRTEPPPVPLVRPGHALVAPAIAFPGFPPRARRPLLLEPVADRIHRLQLPPPPPPRVHRLELIPPTLALTPHEAVRIPSDAAPRLESADPESGRRMGAPHLLTPGALPDGFRYHYDDAYEGWPVAPLHAAHALHGAFDDPREGGYHFGIDIAVDDSHPALRAPAGMSHRVFAVESGVMHYTRHAELSRNCNDRRFEVGHFAYWHASPAVAEGARVRAGQMIGWTCLGEWHLHLSEWALVNGQRTWVNPLHAGGKLRPSADTVAPEIRALYAYGPPAPWWSPQASGDLAGSDGALTQTFDHLHGAVDLRAWIDDAQGDVGLYRDHPELEADISPYRLWVQIRRVSDGAVVWQRDTWQSDVLLTGRQRFYAHFAARSRPPLPNGVCAIPDGCDGRFFYHLLVADDRYLWDTRLIRDGDYVLTVKAFDISGNAGERSVPITVRN
jgi:hypothetical protein